MGITSISDYKILHFVDRASCSDSLVNDERDAQIPFCVFISVYNTLHVSSTSCSSSGERNCINTASGNCHSVSVAVSCAQVGSTMCSKHVESCK